MVTQHIPTPHTACGQVFDQESAGSKLRYVGESFMRCGIKYKSATLAFWLSGFDGGIAVLHTSLPRKLSPIRPALLRLGKHSHKVQEVRLVWHGERRLARKG